SPISRKAAWGLTVLMVVWANCHGSFVVGLALLGLALAGRVLDLRGWRLSQLRDDIQVRRLAACFAASVVLIALCNPQGPSLYWHTWQMARHPNVLAMDEWQPLQLKLSSGGHWSYYATWVVVLLPVVLTRRPYRTDRLLL